MPGGCSLINDTVVVPLVSGARSRSLVMHGKRRHVVFLLDEIHVIRGRSFDRTNGCECVVASSSPGCPPTARVTCLVSSGHSGMKRGQIAHHAFVLFLLVCMDRLCMLAQIVESRKLFSAMTSKRTFSSMFSNRDMRVVDWKDFFFEIRT